MSYSDFVTPQLKNAYAKLTQCLLFKDIINDETIKEFEDILNSSIPHTDFDKGRKSMLLMFASKDFEHVCKFLSDQANKDIRPLILWANVKCISHYFQLKDKVYIKYVDGAFTVGKFDPGKVTDKKHYSKNISSRGRGYPRGRGYYPRGHFRGRARPYLPRKNNAAAEDSNDTVTADTVGDSGDNTTVGDSENNTNNAWADMVDDVPDENAANEAADDVVDETGKEQKNAATEPKRESPDSGTSETSEDLPKPRSETTDATFAKQLNELIDSTHN
jgi:hypothetical protein